jgi:hypothetical protein
VDAVGPVELSADVAITATSTYVNGPNTGAIGSAGQVWVITASAIFHQPTGGPDFYQPRIWNGSAPVGVANYVISANAGINQPAFIQARVTLAGATTFTLQGQNFSSTTGFLGGGSWISAQRIA